MSTARHKSLCPPHSHHAQIGREMTPFQMQSKTTKFPPALKRTLDDQHASGSSTRGSSPLTDDVFSAYGGSSRSSRGTSVPPEELRQVSPGAADSGYGGSDYCSPKPSLPEDNDLSNPEEPERPQVPRRGLPARPSPGSSMPRGEHGALPGSQDTHTSSDESTSETSSDEYDDDSDEGDDNDWSQDDGLENTVIAAVGGNLALASYLIPFIHRDRNAAYVQMIHAWQGATQQQQHGTTRTQCSPSSGGEGSPAFTASSSGGSGSGQHKKRKRSNSDEFGRGLGGRDDEGDGDEDEEAPPSPEYPGPQKSLLLACPFHKQHPEKYSAKFGNSHGKKSKTYRVCAGPGWKSIQRLKEHLRRNHSQVQCGRCFEVFSNGDKVENMVSLNLHSRKEQRCEVGDPSLSEGISEVQWAELDKKGQRRSHGQEGERVGKWFEIWDILFPGTKRPDTPYYSWAVGPNGAVPSYPGREQFLMHFQRILDHMVGAGNLDLKNDYASNVRGQLSNLAGMAFDLYKSTGNGSSEGSSSTNTKTNSNSKQSAETHQTHQSHQTAATGTTLVGVPTTPQQQQQQPQPQQNLYAPAMPRTMPAPQYTVSPMARGQSHPTMMAPQMGATHPVPGSPQMAQMGNYHQQAYYPMQSMAPTWQTMAPQGGFESGQFTMDPMFFQIPDGSTAAWDPSANA